MIKLLPSTPFKIESVSMKGDSDVQTVTSSRTDRMLTSDKVSIVLKNHEPPKVDELSDDTVAQYAKIWREYAHQIRRGISMKAVEYYLSHPLVDKVPWSEVLQVTPESIDDKKMGDDEKDSEEPKAFDIVKKFVLDESNYERDENDDILFTTSKLSMIYDLQCVSWNVVRLSSSVKNKRGQRVPGGSAIIIGFEYNGKNDADNENPEKEFSVLILTGRQCIFEKEKAKVNLIEDTTKELLYNGIDMDISSEPVVVAMCGDEHKTDCGIYRVYMSRNHFEYYATQRRLETCLSMEMMVLNNKYTQNMITKEQWNLEEDYYYDYSVNKNKNTKKLERPDETTVFLAQYASKLGDMMRDENDTVKKSDGLVNLDIERLRKVYKEAQKGDVFSEYKNVEIVSLGYANVSDDIVKEFVGKPGEQMAMFGRLHRFV